MKLTKKENARLSELKMWVSDSTYFGRNPYDFKYKILYLGSNACALECNSIREIKEFLEG